MENLKHFLDHFLTLLYRKKWATVNYLHTYINVNAIYILLYVIDIRSYGNEAKNKDKLKIEDDFQRLIFLIKEIFRKCF